MNVANQRRTTGQVRQNFVISRTTHTLMLLWREAFRLPFQKYNNCMKYGPNLLRAKMRYYIDISTIMLILLACSTSRLLRFDYALDIMFLYLRPPFLSIMIGLEVRWANLLFTLFQKGVLSRLLLL